VLEEGILTPLMQRFADYDHQFRDEDVTIKVYGELGVRAKMETVEPIQLNNRWEYTWLGVEQARNAAQLQQQIAGMNVLKGIPPADVPKGYRMNLSPLMTQMSQPVRAALAPQVLQEDAITVDPVIENGMLENGFRSMSTRPTTTRCTCWNTPRPCRRRAASTRTARSATTSRCTRRRCRPSDGRQGSAGHDPRR
jgi:hypothetical protein